GGRSAASAGSARGGAAAVPMMDGMLALLEGGGGVPGGNRRNAEFASAFTTFEDGVAPALRALLADPMTSGGLLVAAPAALADEMAEALVAAAPETASIGSLEAADPGLISVG